MKIVMLGQSYPPMISGASLFICHLAEALAARGHKVLVIAASDQREPYCQESGNLTVLRLPSYPNPKRVNQRFLIWPENQILAALQDFSPDVIHVHEPFQLAYFARLYSQRENVPCILTIHGLPSMIATHLPENSEFQQLIEKGLWKYAAWLIRQFDARVTPTETIAGMVAEQTGERPCVISGGVDLETFFPDPLPASVENDLRTSFCIPSDACIILHVGRLDEGKNAADIVQAAALVMQRNTKKDIHLLVVGDGCEKNRLVEMAQELGVSEYCHFPGYISDLSRVADVYRISDIFCMASEIETQGLVLLEAAACGLPIVAFNNTAINEIVRDDLNGFLIQPGDVEMMADRMELILEDPELSARMQQASLEESRVHDFACTVNAYENLYLSSIQKRSCLQIGMEEELNWRIHIR